VTSGANSTTTALVAASGNATEVGVVIGLTLAAVLLATAAVVSVVVLWKSKISQRWVSKGPMLIQTTPNPSNGSMSSRPTFSNGSSEKISSNESILDLESWNLLQNIVIHERLGGGNFGDVFRGTWEGTAQVALKGMKEEKNFTQFVREASLLQKLNHPNIVKFFGLYINNNQAYIVMEYFVRGSLDRVLQTMDDINNDDLLGMAAQAASGMQYLESQGIVHRDIALRNLLITGGDIEKYTVKVTDFGLSRHIEKGYYKTSDFNIPFRWCAIESLEYGIFTSKSDVWGFGIMLWEIFSFGKAPYIGMTNQEAIDAIISGYRMEPPRGCPEKIGELMRICWNKDPNKRPNFKQIFDRIQSIHLTQKIIPKRDSEQRGTNVIPKIS